MRICRKVFSYYRSKYKFDATTMQYFRERKVKSWFDGVESDRNEMNRGEDEPDTAGKEQIKRYRYRGKEKNDAQPDIP